MVPSISCASMKPIAIIGAGITGLTAAFYLKSLRPQAGAGIPAQFDGTGYMPMLFIGVE